MSFIATVQESEASGLVADQYQASREKLGYVPNYVKAFSLRPEAYGAWAQLIGTISGNMDLRRYELVTLASALALCSSYCSLAHGKTLSSKIFDPGRVAAIAKDFRNAGLEPVEVAVMEFAQKATLHPHAIRAEDLDQLRRHGLDEAEILDVALAASARNFFSRLLDAVGAPPDDVFLDLEPSMRRALTVGREIQGDPSAEVSTGTLPEPATGID